MISTPATTTHLLSGAKVTFKNAGEEAHSFGHEEIFKLNDLYNLYAPLSSGYKMKIEKMLFGPDLSTFNFDEIK